MKNTAAGQISFRTILVVLAISCCHTGRAQFMGDDVPGDFGLGAGTQDDPSLSISVPYDGYKTSKLKNGSGDVEVDRFTLKERQLSGGLSIVTNLKILGASYGANATVSFASNKIESTVIPASQSAFALTDMFVQPVQLGWHRRRADFVAGYNMYVPTGKYTFGGENNYGLGMWTYEVVGGTTVYLDTGKTWSLSAIMFYETHSNKKNTPYRVGDIFVAEGGLGRSFSIKAGHRTLNIELGPTYYAEFKVTPDRMPVITGALIADGGRDRIFGLGGELNCAVEKLNTSISVRLLDEFGAQTRFEGHLLVFAINQRLMSFVKNGSKKM